MDRIHELARMLEAAIARGDLNTARKLAAEQRAAIDREDADRERMTLALDSF